MNLKRLYYLLCCLILLSASACNEAKIPLLTPPAETGVVHDGVPSKVGDLTNGSPRLTLDEAKVKQALASEIGQGATIEEVYIKQEDQTGRYFLVGHGSLNGVSKAIRVLLTEYNGGLAVASGTQSEICSASNCEECDFLPEGGCLCGSNPPDKMRNGCVHSVTQGSYIYIMFKQ